MCLIHFSIHVLLTCFIFVELFIVYVIISMACYVIISMLTACLCYNINFNNMLLEHPWVRLGLGGGLLLFCRAVASPFAGLGTVLCCLWVRARGEWAGLLVVVPATFLGGDVPGRCRSSLLLFWRGWRRLL